MSIYRVTGWIETLDTCDCPHCAGHEASYQVDTDIEADSLEEAAGNLLEQERSKAEHDVYQWDRSPKVYEVTEEIRMRRLGYKELPIFQNS